MFYENKKETFIKYLIFLMLIIIIFLLWIMVMKMDYNKTLYGNYEVNKTSSEEIIENKVEEEIVDEKKV